jgi:hypothetical protein
MPSRLFRWLASERGPRGWGLGQHPLELCAGQQVEQERGAACGGDACRAAAPTGVDQAAFDAGVGDHELARLAMHLPIGAGEARRHRLDRLAGEAAAQEVAPAGLAGAGRGDVEAAVGRLQRRHVDAPPVEPAAPRRRRSPSRCQLPPPSASTVASRCCIRRAAGCVEAQAPSSARPARQRWRVWKRTPAPRRRCSQARSSGAAFIAREDPARAADEGLDAQRLAQSRSAGGRRPATAGSSASRGCRSARGRARRARNA